MKRVCRLAGVLLLLILVLVSVPSGASMRCHDKRAPRVYYDETGCVAGTNGPVKVWVSLAGMNRNQRNAVLLFVVLLGICVLCLALWCKRR